MILRTIVALVFVTGCGFCGDDGAEPTAPETPTPRAPVAPPDDLVFELALGGGSETLAAAKQLFGRHPLRAVVPESPAELIERLTLSRIDLAERIRGDATAIAVVVGAGYVVAVPVEVDTDRAHPLGPDVVVIPGAPEGGSWVSAAPGPDDPAAVLVGDVLVIGENADALRGALAYAAFTVVPREAAPGLTMTSADDFGSTLRRMLGALVAGEADEARERAREERARHDAPPDFGEPEAVIAHASRFADAWLSYLPDLERIRVALTVDDGTVTATIDGAVRPASPLARRLAETEVASAEAIGALPASTALAWSVRRWEEDATSFSFSQAFTDIAGDRLDDRGRAAVGALAESWDRARGGETVFAAGGGADDAFVAAVLPSPRDEIPDRAITDVLGSRYAASLLALVFDCERVPRPRIGVALCRGSPSLFSANSASRSAFGLTRDLETASRLGGNEGARFDGAPDVERALDALGDSLVMSIVVVPSRIMPLAGLSGSEPLSRISRLSALAARPAPIALGVSVEGAHVTVKIVASDRAVEDALGLFGSL